MAQVLADPPISTRPPQTLRRSLGGTLLYGLGFAILVWSYEGADIRPMALIADSGNMAIFAKEFFPPDFAQWRSYVSEVLITLQIAIWGTFLAVIFAVPLGLMAAENIAPLWLRQPVRRLMDAFRAINEMVFAMLFVVAVGLG